MNSLLTFSLYRFCNEFDWFLILLGFFCFFIFIVLLISVIFESIEKNENKNNVIKFCNVVDEKEMHKESGEEK